MYVVQLKDKKNSKKEQQSLSYLSTHVKEIQFKDSVDTIGISEAYVDRTVPLWAKMARVEPL